MAERIAELPDTTCPGVEARAVEETCSMDLLNEIRRFRYT